MSSVALALGPEGVVTSRDASRPKWFETARRLHDLPVWAQYALATNLVVSILLLRYGLVGNREAYEFVFFMPVILLTLPY